MVTTKEIRRGYKQTEVGAIPKDWEVKRLGELGMWKGGMTPSMQNPSYWLNGDVPWISSGDVKSIQLKKTAYSVTPAAIKQGTTTLLPAKSIVLVTRSGILRKYLPVAMNIIPMAINQDIKALITAEDFSPAFVLHSLISNGPRILSLCMKSGTTVESVEYRWLKAYVIPVPALPEQKVIASALNDVDNLITLLELSVTKKRGIKIATMQQLLTGKRRLPGFKGKWEEKKLSQIADFVKGRGLSKSKLDDSGQFPCILYGELFTTYSQAIHQIKSKTNSGEGLLSKMGDILMPGSTTTTGIDLAQASALHIKDVLIGGDVIVIRMKEESYYNPDFLANYLTHVAKYKIAGITQGITIIHLQGNRLQQMFVKIPTDVYEQTAISVVVSDMENEITELEARLVKTRELKQAMMQQLLTGSIRLI